MKKFKSFAKAFEYVGETLEETNKEAKAVIAENIVKNANMDIVPVLTGDLRKSAITNSAMWKDGEGAWETPYARRRYFDNKSGKPLWITVETHRHRKQYKDAIVTIFTDNK